MCSGSRHCIGCGSWGRYLSRHMNGLPRHARKSPPPGTTERHASASTPCTRPYRPAARPATWPTSKRPTCLFGGQHRDDVRRYVFRNLGPWVQRRRPGGWRRSGIPAPCGGASPRLGRSAPWDSPWITRLSLPWVPGQRCWARATGPRMSGAPRPSTRPPSLVAPRTAAEYQLGCVSVPAWWTKPADNIPTGTKCGSGPAPTATRSRFSWLNGATPTPAVLSGRH